MIPSGQFPRPRFNKPAPYHSGNPIQPLLLSLYIYQQELQRLVRVIRAAGLSLSDFPLLFERFLFSSAHVVASKLACQLTSQAPPLTITATATAKSPLETVGLEAYTGVVVVWRDAGTQATTSPG
jgi:hypothetical protein